MRGRDQINIEEGAALLCAEIAETACLAQGVITEVEKMLYCMCHRKQIQEPLCLPFDLGQDDLYPCFIRQALGRVACENFVPRFHGMRDRSCGVRDQLNITHRVSSRIVSCPLPIRSAHQVAEGHNTAVYDLTVTVTKDLMNDSTSQSTASSVCSLKGHDVPRQPIRANPRPLRSAASPRQQEQSS